MDQFPGNANKAKHEPKKAPPEKKVEKVVEGKVIQKKRSFGSKFKDVFVGDDARTSARYIGYEVLLPALRNMVVEATSKGIERLIYGDTQPRRNQHIPNGPRISYNSPPQRFPSQSANPFQPRSRQGLRTTYSNYEIEDLIFATRSEAEHVLEMMETIVEQYDIVSVADLNELSGLPTRHTDQKWGWSNLRGTHIKQVREGYLLDFPPLEAL